MVQIIQQQHVHLRPSVSSFLLQFAINSCHSVQVQTMQAGNLIRHTATKILL